MPTSLNAKKKARLRMSLPGICDTMTNLTVEFHGTFALIYTWIHGKMKSSNFGKTWSLRTSHSPSAWCDQPHPAKIWNVRKLTSFWNKVTVENECLSSFRSCADIHISWVDCRFSHSAHLVPKLQNTPSLIRVARPQNIPLDGFCRAYWRQLPFAMIDIEEVESGACIELRITLEAPLHFQMMKPHYCKCRH